MAAIIDQAVVSVTNFITALVLARLSSPQELGVYYLAWTLLLFATATQTNLVSVPYTVHAPSREGAARASYLGSTLVHQVLLSMAAVIGLLVCSAAGSWGGRSSNLGSASMVLAAAIPLLLFREYCRRYAFAHLRLRAALAIDGVASAAQLGGLAILAYAGQLSAAMVYAVMGVSCAIASTGWLLVERPFMRFSWREIEADWQHNWTFGKWAFAGQLIGLAFYMLPWLLAAVHGEAATGLFAAANTLVGLANLFVLGLANYLTPRMAQAFHSDGSAGLRHVLRRAALTIALPLGLFCLAILPVAEPLARIVYGPQYAGIGPLIAVLALATLLDGLNVTANNGLLAMNRPAANFSSDVVLFIVTLATAAVLVGPLGPLGIGLAMVLGRAACAAVRWSMLRSCMSVSAQPRAACDVST